MTLQETNMKKLKKLAIKKVTLRDLDEKSMEGMAGGTVKICTAVTFCGISACTAGSGVACC
jgi:natural product precursor